MCCVRIDAWRDEWHTQAMDGRGCFVLLSGCIAGCGSISEQAGLANPEPEGNATVETSGEVRVARPMPDEHGVRVAGGETTDFGSGSSAPPQCRVLEHAELDVEQARALGLESIDRDLALFERRYEAPFHWGPCGSDCRRAGGASEDTRLSLQAEPLTVYRTTSERLPDAPESALCEDYLEYRAVLDLATEDGGFAGRFYARLFRWGDKLAAINIRPDLRNFEGWQQVALDLDRPHWAAAVAWLELGDEGFLGVFDIVVNYTDADSTADGRGEIRTGFGAFWPNEFDAGDILVEIVPSPTEPSPQTQLVALDDYAGSVSTPSCAVSLTVAVFGSVRDLPEGGREYGDFQAVDASVRVDGVALEIAEGPTLGAPPVPWRLGRLAADSSIEVEVRSRTPEGIPHASIDVSPFSVSDQCETPGCTARVEHRVTQYCSY
jgi:hypothetical protein